MDYFRPPFLINRPPLFQPRMEHFNLMHGPSPFHPSMSPFAMATPSTLSLYLQRPPPPPPALHMPMLGGASYMHSYNQHQPRDPRRQRPSKRVRQRMRRLSQRGDHGDELESREGNSESTPIASESGYDTAGDCQTPATPLHSPIVSNGEREFPVDSEKQSEGSIAGHSQSSDSANSVNLSETSLKKLLKDLHRCDVSISKYQVMLDKNCEDGLRNLQEVFSRLHDHLNAREQDLIEELNLVREKATSILQRRKSTASSLRQAAENDEDMLNETQILELKHQIKCFVTDRKVDEEIGTTTYFKADSDDMIRHIMGFGEVIEARHIYTVWDEDPLEMIKVSKNQMSFPPTREDNGQAIKHLQESEVVQLESPSKSQPAESASDSLTTKRQPDNCLIQTLNVSSSTCNDSESSLKADDQSAPPRDTLSPISLHSAPLQPISSQTSPQPPPTRSNSEQATSSINRHTYSYRVSATSSVKYMPKSPLSIKSGRPWHAISKVTTKRAPSLIKHKDYSASKPIETVKNKKPEKKLEQQKETDSGNSLSEKTKEECTVSPTEERGVSPRSKYSRSELQTIQSRIKDSLQQQGVYLYDPVTGDGPLSTTGTRGAGQFSTSTIDVTGERGKTSDQNNTAMRKKKTPTQLRRERKKRQKERERRQRELEKRSEVQLKEQTEDKDSETETKVMIRGDHCNQSDNEEQIISSPDHELASLAAEITTLGEGDVKTTTIAGHHSSLADKLLSSDSERQPESSCSNSQDHSPAHSTSSSTEKNLDDDVPIREDQQEAQANPQCCSGSRETNEEVESVTTEEDTVFSEVTSTADRPLQQDGVNRDRSPSLVVLTGEVASEVKINHKVCHLATKPKTAASVLLTCVNGDIELDGGMQNGIDEPELELKPEE